MNSNEILDREFLEMRAKILEVAASMDRIGRADGDVAVDPRMELIAAAVNVISGSASKSDRAEQIQLLFSRDYDNKWQQAFAVATRV